MGGENGTITSWLTDSKMFMVAVTAKASFTATQLKWNNHRQRRGELLEVGDNVEVLKSDYNPEFVGREGIITRKFTGHTPKFKVVLTTKIFCTADEMMSFIKQRRRLSGSAHDRLNTSSPIEALLDEINALP